MRGKSEFIAGFQLVAAFLPLLLCRTTAAGERPQPEQRRVVGHEVLSVPLGVFCKQKGLPVKMYGEGPCRVVAVGRGAFADIQTILRSSEETLRILDLWTGGQHAFVPENPDPREVYHLVLFASEADYEAFIDFLREKKVLKPNQNREDLVKKLKSLPGPRTMVTVARKTAFPSRFAAHISTMLAVNAFFQARGKTRPPAWLPSGLSAELQRHFGDKRVVYCSVAYETSSPDMAGDWARDVTAMMKRNDKMLRPASQVLEFDLISLPSQHYKLMWSLCTMLVQTAGGRKGKRNKFHKLMEELASGTPSNEAVKKIYKTSDPGLTKAWIRWSVMQR